MPVILLNVINVQMLFTNIVDYKEYKYFQLLNDMFFIAYKIIVRNRSCQISNVGKR